MELYDKSIKNNNNNNNECTQRTKWLLVNMYRALARTFNRTFNNSSLAAVIEISCSNSKVEPAHLRSSVLSSLRHHFALKRCMALTTRTYIRTNTHV